MVNIQSPTAEIRRGKKKKEDGKKLQDENKILWSALLHRATIIIFSASSISAAYRSSIAATQFDIKRHNACLGVSE